MHLLNTVLLPARAYIFSGRTHAMSWVCKAALHNLRTYERRLVHKTFLGYIFAALGALSIFFYSYLWQKYSTTYCMHSSIARPRMSGGGVASDAQGPVEAVSAPALSSQSHFRYVLL